MRYIAATSWQTRPAKDRHRETYREQLPSNAGSSGQNDLRSRIRRASPPHARCGPKHVSARNGLDILVSFLPRTWPAVKQSMYNYPST